MEALPVDANPHPWSEFMPPQSSFYRPPSAPVSSLTPSLWQRLVDWLRKAWSCLFPTKEDVRQSPVQKTPAWRRPKSERNVLRKQPPPGHPSRPAIEEAEQQRRAQRVQRTVTSHAPGPALHHSDCPPIQQPIPQKPLQGQSTAAFERDVELDNLDRPSQNMEHLPHSDSNSHKAPQISLQGQVFQPAGLDDELSDLESPSQSTQLLPRTMSRQSLGSTFRDFRKDTEQAFLTTVERDIYHRMSKVSSAGSVEPVTDSGRKRDTLVMPDRNSAHELMAVASLTSKLPSFERDMLCKDLHNLLTKEQRLALRSVLYRDIEVRAREADGGVHIPERSSNRESPIMRPSPAKHALLVPGPQQSPGVGNFSRPKSAGPLQILQEPNAAPSNYHLPTERTRDEPADPPTRDAGAEEGHAGGGAADGSEEYPYHAR